MIDDTGLQREALLKGEQARKILESDLWRECWDDFEQFIWEQVKATESRDSEKLQHWKRMHVVGIQFKAFFERTIADGQFAARDLEFKEKTGLMARLKRVL